MGLMLFIHEGTKNKAPSSGTSAGDRAGAQLG